MRKNWLKKHGATKNNAEKMKNGKIFQFIFCFMMLCEKGLRAITNGLSEDYQRLLFTLTLVIKAE